MKPYILVTNDDGINAPGIQVLTKLMSQIGKVVVVAPDSARSGQSNAITVNHPIRYKLVEETENLTRYACSGTPTDCVKLAFHTLTDQKPDILVSGINHGSNAAINVIYSGTMGAVFEGCACGIPSIGFSISDYEAKNFSFFEPYILKITEETLRNGLPRGICLNVNAPGGIIKGVRIARQCAGNWVKEFQQYEYPDGSPYFWMTGEYFNQEPDSEDTDEWALANNYLSIVPTTTDMTAYSFMETIKKWNL